MAKHTTLYTQVATIEERRAVWKNAVEAEEKHIKLGLALQGQGVEILNLKQDTHTDPESITKLIQQATTTIEKGINLERDARNKLMELYQQQPREK